MLHHNQNMLPNPWNIVIHLSNNNIFKIIVHSEEVISISVECKMYAIENEDFMKIVDWLCTILVQRHREP